MNHVRKVVALAFLTVTLVTALTSAGQTVEERLFSTLAAISADADQRTAAFMREVAPRHAALKLHELSTPENLARREGRASIRTAYLSFSKIIDDMDSFDRAEEARVGDALSAAVSEFPAAVAVEAEAGFKRGYALTSQRHAALRAAQRRSIRATLELVDVIESAGAGVTLANGRLVFRDRETRIQVSRLLSELGRLEMEEQRLEREIVESRGAPVYPRAR